MTPVLCALLILSAETTAHTWRLRGDAVVAFQADYQDGSDANNDSWPDQWTRRRARGYPAYLRIEIVNNDSPATENNKCLRIQLDGGAAEVFSPSIPVSPHFDYRLNARLRIDGLEHDIVSCVVSFYDQDDALLETTESEQLRRSSGWIELQMGPIRPTSDRIRKAVISVHVRPTDSADLSGSVSIDDVLLSRLPRISLAMNSDHHVYADPRDVSITCRVAGFTIDNPIAKFELLDVTGRTLDVSQQTMTGDSADSRRPPSAGVGLGAHVRDTFTGGTSWKPKIPGYGFYRIRLSSPGHVTWEKTFAVVPPLATRQANEFGWSLPQGERPLSIQTLPTLLSQAGLGWVKFPVWFGPGNKQRAEELALFAERLSRYHVNLIGVLDQPPQDIKHDFGTGEWIPAASLFDNRAVWYQALDPVLTRLSLKVRWWQLGRDVDTSFSGMPQLDGKIRKIRDDLTSFGQQVKVGLPWRVLDQPPSEAQPAWSFLSYVDTLPLTSDEIRSYLDRPDISQCDRWIVLHTLSARHYDLQTRVLDLLQRILAAKIANVQGIFIGDPFHSDRGVMNEDGSPNELFLPWRTAAAFLGGAKYLGSLKLPHGSENHIFSHGNQAVMVVWNEQPVTERIYLGEHVRLHDVWSRESEPMERVEGKFKEQEFAVGRMPTFITGLDTGLTLWRMRFQLQTPRLASVFGPQQNVSFRFQNTFAQAMGGRITLEVPSEWQAELASRHFKLAPGEECTEHFPVRLGADVSSGRQLLRVDFHLSSDREIYFRVEESICVGLGDIVVELATSLDEHGNLIVKQDLVNHSDQNVSFNCLLFVPDRRRERRQVFYLGPGRTTNTFVLPNGRDLLGKTLWLRAEEINGMRMLNEKVVAHE